MPTIADVLKQSGLSQEQIDALDAKVLHSLGGVLTTAEKAQQDAVAKEKSASDAAVKAEAERKAAEAAVLQAKSEREAAELNKRSVDEFWQNTYNPGVAAWEQEKVKLAKAASDAVAEAAFYKAQREGYLGNLSIDPANAPEYKPAPAAAAPGGKFVPGGDGSPVFDTNAFIARATDGMAQIADTQYRYRQLFGKELPLSPSELISKADQVKLSPADYAARAFDFQKRENEIVAERQKQHDDEIMAKTRSEEQAKAQEEIKKLREENEAKLKAYNEQFRGNNGDVRAAVSSKVGDLQRAVANKEMPDPLLMNESQRRAQTAKQIRELVSQNNQDAA